MTEPAALPARTPRRGRVWLFAATVVLAGGLGGAALAGVLDSSTPPESTAARPMRQRQLTALALAHEADASIVDITTRLNGGEAAGSGIVLRSSGEILTNYHVIQGATSITVKISNGSRRYSATVIGTDPSDDVAVLKARAASGLTPAKIGSSADVSVGDRVVAIGNAFNQPGDPAVTEGTVTGLDRSITVRGDFGDVEQLSNLIEMNARLEPGNSGGPLLDAGGEVIGMNAAASSGRIPTGGTTDAFAIPIDDAMKVVRQIEAGRSGGNVHVGPRAFLGVDVRDPGRGLGPRFRPNQRATSGVLVLGVESESAASSAGLTRGDEIIAVDGTAIRSASGLTRFMNTKDPGDTVTVTWIDQSGEQRHASVRLGTGPFA